MRTHVSLLLSLMLGCFASSDAWARVSDEMDHRRWTASSQGPSAVGALAQTADGYLWLGTHDSLYRFDGFDFEKFIPADGEPLGVVSALLSTTAGLWVGFRAGGARLIRPDGVMQPMDPGLPDGVVYTLSEDTQGQVWAAADEGLAWHDGTRWRPVGKDEGFADRHARAVHADADGYLWAASEQQVYMRPPGAPRFIPTGIQGRSVSEITSSASGQVWITDRSRERLLRVLKTGHATIEVEEKRTPNASSIVLNKTGGAWLGTLGNGVQHWAAWNTQDGFSDGQGSADSFSVRDGLSSDYVLAQLIDRDGTLWVGTDAGLDRLQPKALSPLPLLDGAGSDALAVGEDGALWVGSANGQLMRLWGNSHSIFDLEMPITTLVTSEHYGVLGGGYLGVFSVSANGPVRIAPFPVESTPESAIRAMAVGKDGNIWASVNRAGLFVWNGRRWRRVEPVSDSDRQVMPVSASRDQTGKLWFGYRENLLVSIDDQSVEHWGEAQGLSIGHVTAMLHLPERTWVGGQHGLAYLKEGRFHSLDLPAPDSFKNIYALVAVPARKNQDEAGQDIWVHSRGGIFRLPAAEIERVIAGGDTLLYTSHDHIGRLPMDPFKVLPLPTAVYTPEGSLWFATGSGVARVDPYRPAGQARPTTVTIKGLTVDGIDFDVSNESVRVAAAPRQLVIHYSALNLSAPETLRFQYRLRGHDAEWVDAGRSRQAVYSRLRAGDYEFQVRALDEDGVFNLSQATLPFVVPKVFYLRPWFLLLVTIALGGLLLWFSRVNLRREKAALRTRLEERFQERERIARELHDTLLQSVQGMMLSFQAVADNLPEGSPARDSMERALDRAEQVIAEGRDRISGLRGQMAPAEDLATAFQALALEAGRSGATVVRVSNTGKPLALRQEVRDAFYQIGREAVLNALSHAQASEISVTLSYTPGTFGMLVVDDGIGIDPLYQRMHGRPQHGGLRGMYERAGRIDATLTICSNAENGTRIRLSLPGPAAYKKATDER